MQTSKMNNFCIVLFSVAFLCCDFVSANTVQTSDPNASSSTRAVQAYLLALSNDSISGVIAGQNAGHSDDIGNAEGLTGYIPLILNLEKQTGQMPGIIGVDYEHNKIATSDQLKQTNKILIDYWNAGGLITINWSPHNPWWNDESNISKNPGVWTDTRTSGGDMRSVDLTELIKQGTAANKIWRKKLDRIAEALLELQKAGVVVLWRPLQEMNGNWFWWGISSAPNDPQPYIALWHDMHHYFTDVKGLHNLLWVYSPNQRPTVLERSFIKPIEWRYPGKEYVDVVAGTAYNNRLDVRDYKAYLRLGLKWGKPLGMAEFGPVAGRRLSREGDLDTQEYSKQLQHYYPGIAYWVSWSSWDNGDGTRENQALIHNKNVRELLNEKSVITRQKINWKDVQLP